MIKKGRHVLVVDDEAPIRYVIARVLSRVGYQVSEACNGVDAIATIQQSSADGARMDLLLLDLHMPDMDGPTLVKELIRQDACPPLLFLTGGIKSASFALPPGAICLGFLDKPVSKDELIDAVAKAFITLPKQGPEASCTP